MDFRKPVTRRRIIPFGWHGGITSFPKWGSPSQSNETPIVETQVTDSHNNMWDNRHYRQFRKELSAKGKLVDYGGPFYTIKPHYNPGSTKKVDVLNSNGTVRFRGTIVPTVIQWSLAKQKLGPKTPADNLHAWGSDAIAKVAPNKPAFDGAVNAAELIREGLPKMVGTSLVKSKFKDVREYGNEYLNLQFGVRPLLSGIKDLQEVSQKSSDLWHQLQRDSGKIVRRRYMGDLEEHIETQDLSSTSFVPVHLDTSFVPTGYKAKCYREIKTTSRKWFSGAFTYYLPKEDGEFIERIDHYLQKAKLLYGVRIDPEVVWNLTPWSWASDWIVNGGTLASNLSNFSQNGLVMRYGYVMETRTVTITDTMRNVRLLNGSGTFDLQHSWGFTEKVRYRATPYGFGLNPDTFSPYQWSIIGALGISKIPKSLGH